MRARSVALLVSAFVSAACGGASTPEGLKTPTPPTPPALGSATTTKEPDAQAKEDAPKAAATFDPLTTGMTPDGVRKLCDEHLAKAKQIIESIKAQKGAEPAKLTFEGTFGRFDDATAELSNALDFPYLMGFLHPDEAVRIAAKACEPKVAEVQTSLWLDADLASVLRAYTQKGEKREGESARLVADVSRDFRRNGSELGPDKQARLREIDAAITTKGQEFVSRLSKDETIEIDPKDLAGLPKEYVASHPPDARGKVRISTNDADYTPFITYAKNRKAALELYVKFTNTGGKENVKLIGEILALRHEKAKLLGYETWADYAIEPRMAKTKKGARELLDKIREALKEPVKAELEELKAQKEKLGGKKTDALVPPDRAYLEDQVKRAKYAFESQALSEYFEVRAVTKGLLDITAKMYGLEYREAPANAWHADVSAYEVWSKDKRIGKVYFDLYLRPNKFGGIATFPVRVAKRLEGGAWQEPMAAIVANFPKPGASPSLLSHDDVVTLLHEYGHVMHQLLTRSELARYSGTNTARDFSEAPSQMFEEWAWSREALDVFAKHHQSGQKIPDALFEAMTRARAFGRALATQRQIFMATLDLELHSRVPPFDTTKVVEEVQTKIDSFLYVKGTHFESSFWHLITYDAGYYGYQWSLAFAYDALTRFRKEGLMNPTTAASWRDEVLAKGGGADERAMLSRFLGREPSIDAYLKYLQNKE